MNFAADHERARLFSLRQHDLLDTPHEAEYDDLVALASQICQTPIALVSLIDAGRQWFKACIGLEVSETAREIAFCNHAIAQDQLFTVNDASGDPRFWENPLVVNDPNIRFYSGMPLCSATGQKLGTLCVIDRLPRNLTPFQETALRTLARQVEAHFALRLRVCELRLREEQARAQRDALLLLEQQKQELMLLVTHDLKNPIAALLPCAEALLEEEGISDEGRQIAGGMKRITLTMNRLVMDLLDLSRAEEGKLRPRRARLEVSRLLEESRQAASVRAGRQGNPLTLRRSDEELWADADPELLRRVVDNLLDNALKYSPASSQVSLAARVLDDAIEVRITDTGLAVPESLREQIFEKYARGDPHAHRESSRGLGLAFCKMAINAHGGRIWVEQTAPQGNAFCFTVPRAGA